MDLRLAFSLIVLVIIAVLLVLKKLRHSDIVNANKVWRRLAKKAEEHSPVFDESMLDGVPELVKKFFLFMIKPGTPLHYISVLKMHGVFAMGDSQKSHDVEVKCSQILAPLQGFVWKVKSTQGLIRFSGSDGLDNNHCWSRMWLMGLWPLWQRNRHDNITKSSFGRMAAESTVWALAALLPKSNVSWEAIDDAIIRVTLTTKLMTQKINITVDETGQPKEVIFNRWSNANSKKQFRFQPFGAKISAFKEVQGFMVPMQIEAGNHYGTKDYFSFYKMTVDSFEFV